MAFHLGGRQRQFDLSGPAARGPRGVASRIELGLAILYQAAAILGRTGAVGRLWCGMLAHTLTSNLDLELDLQRDGACVLRGVLPAELLDRIDPICSALADGQGDEEARRQRFTGSLIGLDQDPCFASLIAHPGILAGLASLGWHSPKFMNGYLTSKPPGGPALYWHQDWWGWDDEISYRAAVPMAFVMVYTCATAPANGCLRIIPGSHRRRIDLHDQLPEAHTRTASAADAEGPAHGDHPLAVDVPVRRGDVVIGDARVLHATHANRSGARRTVITMWFIPDFAGMPESMRSEITRQTWENPHRAGQGHQWPAEAERLVAPLRPDHPAPWNIYRWVQQPDARLCSVTS